MKSSTLHRSNLSKERMSMIENVKPQSYNGSTSDINRYIKFQRKPELDVLWRDFEKSVQSKSKAKAPIIYAGIGFVLGLLFALGIAVIIGLSMYFDTQKPEFTPQPVKIQTNETSAAIIPSGSAETTMRQTAASEEKYTIKEGDTLDKVAFRFYGKYDLEKINKIMELNNIKDETKIQIGQVLIIPLD